MQKVAYTKHFFIAFYLQYNQPAVYPLMILSTLRFFNIDKEGLTINETTNNSKFTKRTKKGRQTIIYKYNLYQTHEHQQDEQY